MVEKFKELVLGKPRDIKDPQIFHRVSLVAFLAWVGLGADGLSYSAYGPDEAFRALGPHTHLSPYKLSAEFAALGVLILLDLRGVKESVTILAPIFMVFIVSHAFAILYAIGSRFTQLPEVFHGASTDFHGAVSTLGFWPVAFILLHAYSMGGGTYTGIEAVSNGITMLREPRVQTGKKTMFLMATS